jgi:hypothetical protein
MMEQRMKAMMAVAILAAVASVTVATTADARGRHGGGKSFGIAKSMSIGGKKHHFRHRFHSYSYVVPFCQEWKFYRTRFGLKKVCVFY